MLTTPVSGASGGIAIGQADVSGSPESAVYPAYNDNNTYFRLNSGSGGVSVSAAFLAGLYVSNRSGTTVSGYQWGLGIGSGSPVTATETASALINANVAILARKLTDGTVSLGYAGQVAMASIGASLTTTQANDLATAVCSYLAAVHGSC